MLFQHIADVVEDVRGELGHPRLARQIQRPLHLLELLRPLPHAIPFELLVRPLQRLFLLAGAPRWRARARSCAPPPAARAGRARPEARRVAPAQRLQGRAERPEQPPRKTRARRAPRVSRKSAPAGIPSCARSSPAVLSWLWRCISSERPLRRSLRCVAVLRKRSSSGFSRSDWLSRAQHPHVRRRELAPERERAVERRPGGRIVEARHRHLLVAERGPPALGERAGSRPRSARRRSSPPPAARAPSPSPSSRAPPRRGRWRSGTPRPGAASSRPPPRAAGSAPPRPRPRGPAGRPTRSGAPRSP